MEFKKFAVGLNHYGESGEPPLTHEKQEQYVSFYDKDNKVERLLGGYGIRNF